MDTHLRRECQSLLQQLKSSQQQLKAKVGTDKDLTSSSSFDTRAFKENTFRSSKGSLPLTQNLNTNSSRNYEFDSLGNSSFNVLTNVYPDMKPNYARNKLVSLTKSEYEAEHPTRKHLKQGSAYFSQDEADLYPDTALKSMPLTELSSNVNGTTSATTTTQLPRQIIDRHTRVSTKLTLEELKDLEDERRLNFSYSHIDACDNIPTLQSSSNKADSDSAQQKPTVESKEDVKSQSKRPGIERAFKKQLEDDGNNRRLNNFVKETLKPKSLPNSFMQRSLTSSKRSNTSQFSADASHNKSHAFAGLDQRMLGYDWIAALLDNDSGLIDQSESFFNDLRDFRRLNKQECSNQFYMETPHTLVDYEPQPVVDALTEPNVHPYIVNERLFTQKFKPDLIDYDEDPEFNRGKPREPTKEQPRFVRVSIPRSTLETPYRVKAHRRRSFDDSDSMSLIDHCLLGWENTRPAMIPAARSLDLNSEAGTRVDSQITTLAEAERLATAASHSQWPFTKPFTRSQTLPTWRKHYMDTAMNMSVPAVNSLSMSSSGLSGNATQTSASVKRATDKLLNDTYSTMYEMERLREERKLEKELYGDGK